MFLSFLEASKTTRRGFDNSWIIRDLESLEIAGNNQNAVTLDRPLQGPNFQVGGAVASCLVRSTPDRVLLAGDIRAVYTRVNWPRLT